MSRRRVRTVTPPTAARLLDVHPNTVLKLIDRGILPALDIGTGKVRRFIIFRKDLVAFMLATRGRGYTVERVGDVVGF